jgi:hypothetical protein
MYLRINAPSRWSPPNPWLKWACMSMPLPAGLRADGGAATNSLLRSPVAAVEHELRSSRTRGTTAADAGSYHLGDDAKD